MLEILLCRDSSAMASYFSSCFNEFEHIIIGSSAISQNGDDAIELYFNDAVVETFGDIAVDGSGEAWEYQDSFAYKVDGAWTYGGVDCTDGSDTSATSSCPYPYTGVYTTGTAIPVDTFNITFSVNTANITVGENGMYLGGGVFGGSNAHFNDG